MIQLQEWRELRMQRARSSQAFHLKCESITFESFRNHNGETPCGKVQPTADTESLEPKRKREV